jgi:hypothetical protein
MKLLKRLTDWWVQVGNGKLTVSSVDSPFVPNQQQDTRDIEVKKRVREAFKEQKQQIDMMAMKQHSCNDPMSCTKEKCFVWQPDKIVSKPYKVTRKVRMKDKRGRQSFYNDNEMPGK